MVNVINVLSKLYFYGPIYLRSVTSIVFILLMLSILIWPKVIRLSDFYCIIMQKVDLAYKIRHDSKSGFGL